MKSARPGAPVAMPVSRVVAVLAALLPLPAAALLLLVWQRRKATEKSTKCRSFFPVSERLPLFRLTFEHWVCKVIVIRLTVE